jgi:TolB-like protein/Tfp pilus assembly protein PilF
LNYWGNIKKSVSAIKPRNLAWHLKLPHPPPIGPENIKSVAILPFENLSADKDQEYFCDGMTEDIITKLSQAIGLKVIPRASVMFYKGKNIKILDIGKELKVATILKGSVRKRGNRIRITAQLINAKTEAHIWAETYDRDIDLKDIFNLQTEVTLNIVNALKENLSTLEKEMIKKRPTENSNAYDFYLMARNYSRRLLKQDNEQAIKLLKKALEYDPEYARAYAALAGCYTQRVLRFGFDPKWLDKALELIQKAIKIDPNSAKGYHSLGSFYYTTGQIKKAIEASRKSVNLNSTPIGAIPNLVIGLSFTGKFEEAMTLAIKRLPNATAYPWSYFSIGMVYRGFGDHKNALPWIDKALELQPELSETNHNRVICLVALGKHQQALEQSQKYLAIAPERYTALFYAGYVELFSNNLDQAIPYFQKSIKLFSVRNHYNLCNTTLLGYIFWQKGEQDRARKLLDQSLNFDHQQLHKGNELFAIPLDLATIYAIRGENEEALKWFQKVIDTGWDEFPDYLIDSLWANLRHDERFIKMMAKVNAKNDKISKKIDRLAAGLH